jgi:hypothetical protein
MKTGRNDPCDCGSGKKFKNCHAEKTPERLSTNRMGWIVVAIVAAGAVTLFASFRPDPPDRSPGTAVSAAPVAPVSATPTRIPPPPGEPPPGKIWSYEHGHWHNLRESTQIDFSNATVPGSTPASGEGSAISVTQAPPSVPGTPQPAGPVPPGKVWSIEHGHWHDVDDTAADSGVPAEIQPLLQPPGIPAAPPGMVWSEEHQHWHDAAKEAERRGTVKTDTAPKP